QKKMVFDSPARLTLLTNSLFELAASHGSHLQAWAVFANHYHFVATSANGEHVRTLIRHLHSLTARQVNRLDGFADRKVWFQYWDTTLTYKKSYLARLSYVHWNPVRHGLVREADAYPWCSAGWFRKEASRALYRTVMEFPTDRVNVPDDFE